LNGVPGMVCVEKVSPSPVPRRRCLLCKRVRHSGDYMTVRERVLSRNLPLSPGWSPQVASTTGKITSSHEVGAVLTFMIDTDRHDWANSDAGC
jgi:hypothetical protein